MNLAPGAEKKFEKHTLLGIRESHEANHEKKQQDHYDGFGRRSPFEMKKHRTSLRKIRSVKENKQKITNYMVGARTRGGATAHARAEADAILRELGVQHRSYDAGRVRRDFHPLFLYTFDSILHACSRGFRWVRFIRLELWACLC